MANTKIIIFYIMFLVFFNFFAGSFSLSQETKEFDITNYAKVSQIRDKLKANDGILSSIFSIVLAPFLLIDYLIILIVLMGLGVTILPPIVNILLFTPLGILFTFDYVLPYARGN